MIKFSCQSHLSTLLVRTEIWIIADCTQIFEKLIFFQIFQYFKRNIWKFERNIGKFERNIGKFVQFSDFCKHPREEKTASTNWIERKRWNELSWKEATNASLPFNSIQFNSSLPFNSVHSLLSPVSIQFNSFITSFQFNNSLIAS